MSRFVISAALAVTLASVGALAYPSRGRLPSAGGSSSADTCTGGACDIGSAGIATDGGIRITGGVVSIAASATSPMIISGQAGVLQKLDLNSSSGSTLQYDTDHLIRVDSAQTKVFGNLAAADATNKGTITLVAGTASRTVASGSACVCSNTTAALACVPGVSGTTLTVTSGVGTDVVAYLCL